MFVEPLQRGAHELAPLRRARVAVELLQHFIVDDDRELRPAGMRATMLRHRRP